jgi:hypothetical protein
MKAVNGFNTSATQLNKAVVAGQARKLWLPMNQNVPEIEVFEPAITAYLKIHHNRHDFALT